MIFDNKELFIATLRKLPEYRKLKQLTDVELYARHHEAASFMTEFESYEKSEIIRVAYEGDKQTFKLIKGNDSASLKLSGFRVIHLSDSLALSRMIAGLRNFLRMTVSNDDISEKEAIKIFGKCIEFINTKGGCDSSVHADLKAALFALNCDVMFSSSYVEGSTHSILNPALEASVDYTTLLKAYSEMYDVNCRHLKSTQELGLQIQYQDPPATQNTSWLGISIDRFEPETILTGSTGGGALRDASWLLSIIGSLRCVDQLGDKKSFSQLLTDPDYLSWTPVNSLRIEVLNHLAALRAVNLEQKTEFKNPVTKEVPKFRWVNGSGTITSLIAVPSNLLLTIMSRVASHIDERILENDLKEEDNRESLRSRYSIKKEIGIVGSNPQNVSALYQELFGTRGVPRFRAYFNVREESTPLERQFSKVNDWFENLSVDSAKVEKQSLNLAEYQGLSLSWLPAKSKEKADKSKALQVARLINKEIERESRRFKPKTELLEKMAITPLQKVLIGKKLDNMEISELMEVVNTRLAFNGLSGLTGNQKQIIKDYFENEYLIKDGDLL